MIKKFILSIILFFVFSSTLLALEIDSSNMIIYNMNDDIIVGEKNKDEKISIASMTKIMTTIVAIENIKDYEKQIIVPKEALKGLYEANASVAGFKSGQLVTYNDLLYGSLLASGADATNTLAISIAGSISKYVELMNKKAKDLGLKNTHFSNTTGLDDINHYSTVYDVSLILKYALKNEKFKEIFLSKKYLTKDNTITINSTMFKTISKFDNSINYIKGGKTGFTGDAGRCLASISYDDKNKINYLLVTAGANKNSYFSHVKDAKTIYEYYFNNYSYKNILEDKDYIVVDTLYTKEENYKINLKPVNVYLKNDEKYNLEIKYEGIKPISYNLEKGTKLGTVKIIYNDKIINEETVYLNKKLSFSLKKFVIINKEKLLLGLILVITLITYICKKHFIKK